ncbi:MAG: type III-B CRISPR module RAMP protein Cmr6 [Bacteroidetes bacterium 4572_77]|nr:MAG: type III-B CRISPR module RAMP protein Cmr6 [Bacteroidetes bacterium 4572_77]
MEKGKIKIKKNGTAAINKKIAVPKLFDLSSLIPESGSVTFDCEFEVNANNAATRIIVNGVEIGENNKLKKDQEKKEKHKILKASKTGNFIDILKSFVPQDTAGILEGQEYIVDNFNLELNKLPRYEDGKFQFFKTDRNKIVYQPKPKFSKDLIDQISENEKSTAKSLFKNDSSFKAINFKPNWRIIVGLGGESVYETSITLHHIYGIPYIPASSIKGVVRSWVINTVFGSDDLKLAEGKAIGDKSFCDFFGCPAELKIDKAKFESYYTQTVGRKKGDRKGKLVFLDAFPIIEPKIEVDIMNTHYSDYYSGSKPPTDTQNPVPIMFLTVAETNFQFIIGTKENSLLDYTINERPIVEWLKEALSLHGIGAKTAVGYGRLNVV